MLLILSYVCYVFFFFKQKTAYEMRISDWSSDVCSSDLLDEVAGVEHVARGLVDLAAQAQGGVGAGPAQVEVAVLEARLLADLATLVAGRVVDRERSEERRGGKECVST